MVTKSQLLNRYLYQDSLKFVDTPVHTYIYISQTSSLYLSSLAVGISSFQLYGFCVQMTSYRPHLLQTHVSGSYTNTCYQAMAIVNMYHLKCKPPHTSWLKRCPVFMGSLIDTSDHSQCADYRGALVQEQFCTHLYLARTIDSVPIKRASSFQGTSHLAGCHH